MDSEQSYTHIHIAEKENAPRETKDIHSYTSYTHNIKISPSNPHRTIF